MVDRGHYRYQAIDPAGRRVRGAIPAVDEAAAYSQLRAQGFAPLSLRRGRVKPAGEPAVRPPPDRESAEFLSSLADLLRAGADIRTALGILGSRAARSRLKVVGDALTREISGGEAIDRAFGRIFRGRQDFVAAMVAAGETAGDLPGGLQRAADVFYSRQKLRDQLVSVLAYPAFVLASAVASVMVILLFIVPSIAPLAEDAGTTPPASLGMLIAASEILRENLRSLGLGAAAAAIALVACARAGLLAGAVERLVLDGPAARTVRGLIFGSFAVSLGTMLAAGAPVTDSLRLAAQPVRTRAAQRRLATLVQIVREGQSLSRSLETVKGFPASITRLAAVGEATNSLGAMLIRGGRLEEDAAMRRIETLGRVAGPALIILLGLMLGSLMGGLLSGVSQMGQGALN